MSANIWNSLTFCQSQHDKWLVWKFNLVGKHFDRLDCAFLSFVRLWGKKCWKADRDRVNKKAVFNFYVCHITTHLLIIIIETFIYTPLCQQGTINGRGSQCFEISVLVLLRAKSVFYLYPRFKFRLDYNSYFLFLEQKIPNW